MPVYKQNTKIGEIVDELTDIDKRYHNQLVFQSKIAVNTVLYQGPFTIMLRSGLPALPAGVTNLSSAKVTIPTKFDLTKLKNGIQINFSNQVLSFDRTAGGVTYSHLKDGTFSNGLTYKITKNQLLSKAKFNLLEWTTKTDGGVTWQIQVTTSGGPTLTFGALYVGYNQTAPDMELYEFSTTANITFAIIDSITAY